MRLAATLFAALAFVPTTEAAVTRARYLMGTVCEVAVASEADAERVFVEAARIEDFLSTWREGSELSRVNRGEIEAGPELKALLDLAMQWRARTNGTFDPVWSAAAKPPLSKAAAGAAALQTDPGAFGKGYALDRMLETIAGDAMINFGGQIIVRGSVEASIADPLNRQKPLLTFILTNASLSTSSNAERLHIIDPRSGKPAPAWGSVSVIADDGLTADILSTALFVMGEDDGLRWADAHGVAAIFIDNHRHIRASARARHFIERY